MVKVLSIYIELWNSRFKHSIRQIKISVESLLRIFFVSPIKCTVINISYKNIPLRVKKNNIDNPAPTGNVTTQETIILPTTEKSTADSPLAKPTPSTAPTSV